MFVKGGISGMHMYVTCTQIQLDIFPASGQRSESCFAFRDSISCLSLQPHSVIGPLEHEPEGRTQ